MPAWMPSSVNVPASIRRSSRSRAVSLSCCVLARDPLLAAAQLGLGAALVQVVDEGSQHRGGNIPSVPRFGAIIFDLLTALLDSWTLWGAVAGDEEEGARRRRKSLELIYASGEYRPYEEIVAEAAGDERFASELLRRWDELEPWPEAPAVLRDLARDHRLALVTNTSEDLARRAAREARRRGRRAGLGRDASASTSRGRSRTARR